MGFRQPKVARVTQIYTPIRLRKGSLINGAILPSDGGWFVH